MALPEVDITRSVLQNLNKLLEADDLYAQGEKHLDAGRLADALDCFARAAECCPGSPSSLMAQAATYRVFARIYRASSGAVEEAEPRSSAEPEKKPSKRHKRKKQPRRKTTRIETVINGIALKPSADEGSIQLAVPVVPLTLKIEEQTPPPDRVGGTEEAEEPSWFLPWHEDWTGPGKTASLLQSLLEGVCLDAAQGLMGWRYQAQIDLGPTIWRIHGDAHSVSVSLQVR